MKLWIARTCIKGHEKAKVGTSTIEHAWPTCSINNEIHKTSDDILRVCDSLVSYGKEPLRRFNSHASKHEHRF